jgi:hypothetical protein
MGRRRELKRDDVTDLFAKTAPRRRKTPYDRKYKRYTYRLQEMTRDKLKAIAEQNGIGLNDLVRWVLDRFIYGYERGEVVLPIEEYVVTKSRLSE